MDVVWLFLFAAVYLGWPAQLRQPNPAYRITRMGTVRFFFSQMEELEPRMPD